MSCRFFCLCMSPALDCLVRLPRAIEGRGEVIKDVSDVVSVGGKAINVARWLALRGNAVVCGGILGAANDRAFVDEFARHSIVDACVRVPGETRRNEMIVWPGHSTKLNRAAFAGADLSSLRLETLLAGAAGCEVAVLSGSLPPGLPNDFYARCIRRLRAQGTQCVLDASGAALKAGLTAGPDWIKPNAEECEAVTGFVPHTPEEFARATQMLRGMSSHVVISDGAAGAWFDGVFVQSPAVEALDTTAAGDTLLAEFCHRHFAMRSAEAPQWAVAAGAAACTLPGGTPPPPDVVARLVP